MEPERFDGLAASVAKNESSRRSMLFRFGGSGVAAFLAAVGIGGLDVDEAEAKKSCKKRCKKKDDKDKRRRCKRRCRKKGGNTPGSPNSFPITVNLDLLGDACTPTGGECGDPNDTGLECVASICVPVDLGDIGDTCADGSDCATGRCSLGLLCTDCPVASICGTAGNQVCCVVDATCAAGVCVLNDV